MPNYTFISYASEDANFALRLAHYLQQRGVPVWIDQERSEVAGEEGDRAVANALRGAAHYLLILSPSAVDSWVVREQTTLAIHEDKPLLLLLHQPCAVPAPLAEQPIIDITAKGQSLPQAMHQLLTALSAQPPPDPLPGVWRLQLGLAWDWISGQPHLLWSALVALLIVWAAFTLGLPEQAGDFPEQEVVAPERLSRPIVVPTIGAAPATVGLLPTPLETYVRPRDGKIMVLIPTGDFLMGSTEVDPEAEADEKPQRLVYLDSFWIDKTEISNSQYSLCVEAGDCTPSSVGSSDFKAGQLPVVGVNWEQSAAYCRWTGARLPSEAEWEKAARGQNGRIYPWGNQFDPTRLNYCDKNCISDTRDNSGDDGYRMTAPIGAYPAGASPYGVLDMSGNVWEWIADWYDPDIYRSMPYRNPVGPAQGEQRVIRGGSWLYTGRNMRTAQRHRDVPTSSYENIGFRCALSDVGGNE